MTSRRRRIEKLVQHRERELEQRVAELQRTQLARVRAEDAAHAERKALERAFAERGALTAGKADASSWSEANDWLDARARKHALALDHLKSARSATERARSHVVKSHTDLKKLEALGARIEAEERTQSERRERRLEDETAQVKYAQKRKGEP